MRIHVKRLTGSLCICLAATSLWAQDKPSQRSLLEAERQGAATNDPAASIRYAKDLNEGRLGRRNYSEAFHIFSIQSQQGSAEASAWLGSMYLLGHGVQADTKKARSLLRDGAAHNDGVALRFLGVMAQNGIDEKQDYSKALRYYRLASHFGDINSFDKRGVLRLSGLGAPKSSTQAFRLFYKGASMGDSWAQLHLGQLLRSGRAYPDSDTSISAETPRHDYFHAIQWFKLSAKQNNRVAQYELGNMVLHGHATARHPKWAFILFQKSASRRYAPAYFALGQAFENGRGTKKSMIDAFVAYSLAAEQGHHAGSLALTRVSSSLSEKDLQTANTLLKQHRQRSLLHAEAISEE